MRILISGGTGFIGTALCAALRAEGHTLLILSRSERADAEGVQYVRSLQALDGDACIDAVINLAGASLAGKRWNAAYKRELVASRMDTTRDLVALCQRLSSPPAVMLSASAIGFYGNRGDETVDEQSGQGEGFSAQLCADWEREAQAVTALGTRLCLLRLGVVFDRKGGAFEQMVLPFRMGVANWIGDGRQWLSWVHRSDVVAACQFLLADAALSGVFNLTAPEPVRSRELCAAIKRHLRTLVTLPMPAAAMRLMVGEMADELLISGQRVLPARLQTAGFRFAYPDVDSALQQMLG
jgi:uncharacterized protein (TIGR01777 family)